jgi:quercetin dioxygenase-like cupin family protein
MKPVEIVHHFCAGVYTKETHIPRGVALQQHAHAYDHLSVLAAGKVIVIVDGRSKNHEAPAVLTIKAGQQHTVIAKTNVVWLCIHKTDDTDPNTVDQSILKG